MSDPACAVCDDDLDTGEHSPACPWSPQTCPVEGCRFEFTDDDGCGLVNLSTVEESIRRWDAGDPIFRGCLAMRRAESSYVRRTFTDA